MSFSFVHAVSAAEFLDRSLKCPRYMRSTYVDGLGFKSCDVELERFDAQDQLFMRVLSVQPDIPEWGWYGAFVGAIMKYKEVSILRDGVWTSDLVPVYLTNRVRLTTQARVEPIDASTCRCIFDVELTACVPGIGWLIERRLARLIRIVLAKSHVHSTAWLALNPPPARFSPPVLVESAMPG